jgi:hypothetical protein
MRRMIDSAHKLSPITSAIQSEKKPKRKMRIRTVAAFIG